MIKTLCERLLERGNDDLLDGCEDKTSRGMLDLAAVYEIKRLRSILKAIADATDKGARYESLAVWNTAEGALRGIVDPVPTDDEIERLRAALTEIQRQTYGSRWEAAVTAHAIATQALDGAVTAKLAVERIAQELATRSADEPESKS